MIEQEKMDRHNILKRKMAMEYEIRSARNRDLPLLEGRCNKPGRSESESPPSRHRRIYEHYTPEVTMLSKKFHTLSGTSSLFKEPAGPKMSPTELRKIQIAIHRNIAGGAAADELQRDVPDKEDVVLKRRAGEGSNPIFDREEIRRATPVDEVEEFRTVFFLNPDKSENELKTLKRRSASLSPTRSRRRHSPRPTRPRHPRENIERNRSDRQHRERSRDQFRDRKRYSPRSSYYGIEPRTLGGLDMTSAQLSNIQMKRGYDNACVMTRRK